VTTARIRWLAVAIVVGVAILTIVRRFNWEAPEFQISEINLEELLGVIAVTTFLVGFEANRLQSMLSDWKELLSRSVDRVLEQNLGDNLLPLPPNFEESEFNTSFAPGRNRTTKNVRLLVALTWVASTVLLMASQLRTRAVDVNLWLFQSVHLLICIMGWRLVPVVVRAKDEYLQQQPHVRYREFEKAVARYLLSAAPSEDERAAIANEAANLDDSLPDWCWSHLVQTSIRGTVPETRRVQLQRIHRLANQAKEYDSYSLIAFVWTAYLTDCPEAPAAQIVKQSDIRKIMEFSLSTRSDPSPGSLRFAPAVTGGDIYAEMTLREALRVWGEENQTDWVQEVRSHLVDLRNARLSS